MATALTTCDFSYDGLPAKDVDALEQHAETIVRQGEAGRGYNAMAMLGIGRELKAAQARLANHGNGTFQRWVKDRCDIAPRTAYYAINAVDVFKDKDCATVARFDLSAMYLLSSDSTPEAATVEALRLAAAGERITKKRAQEIIGSAKETILDALPAPETARADDLLDKWEVEPGQLWTIGPHRLLCGDATDGALVDKLMAGAQARVFATDPPYGVDLSQVCRQGDRTHGDGGHDALAGDDNAATATAALDATLGAFLPYLTADAAFFIWHAHSNTPELFEIFERRLGKRPHQLIIWHKSHFVIGRNHYHLQHELCLYSWRDSNQPPLFGERNQVTVWDVDGGGGHKHPDHPTEKPVEVFTMPIENHTQRGEVIVDPFLGSGTAMVAAQATGRVCYAMEISPAYVAVALERMSGMGLEPTD